MRPRTRFYTKWLASFFRIPAEIRNFVYHLVSKDAVFINIAQGSGPSTVQGYRMGRYCSGQNCALDNHDYGHCHKDAHLLGLLQTCQHIRSEPYPLLLEHLAVSVRGQAVDNPQLTVTYPFLREVRVLSCNLGRALPLDFGNFPKLDVLVITPPNTMPCGMPTDHANVLAGADLPKLLKIYRTKKLDSTKPTSLSDNGTCKFSMLVGIQDMPSSGAPGTARAFVIKECFTDNMTCENSVLTVDRALSKMSKGRKYTATVYGDESISPICSSHDVQVVSHQDVALSMTFSVHILRRRTRRRECRNSWLEDGFGSVP